MKGKYLKLGALLSAALLAVTAAGVTVAILQTGAKKVTNTFEAGGVTTEIVEEGSGTVKKSRIRNTGKSDCVVRARVTISPAEAASAIVLTDKGENWNWEEWENGDGFVYYEAVLPAGEASYTTWLFEGVALKEGVDWTSLGITTFEVTVYEESVQSEVYDSKTAGMISVLDKDGGYDSEKAARVWAVYENAVDGE